MKKLTLAAAQILFAMALMPSASAQDTGTVPGQWSMSHRWVQGGGSTDYGTVLADLQMPKTYQICRTRGDTVGVQTRELRLFVDNVEVPNYSLDHGSCIIAKGKKFHLRYKGPNVGMLNILFGRYGRLDPETLLTQNYRQISRWSMNWVKNETAHHKVRLVQGVPGDYRVCFKGSELGFPTPTPPNSILTLRLRIDGNRYVRLGNQAATYRQMNCVDVEGSTIEVEMASWPPGLSYFRFDGTLSLRSDIPTENP